MAPLSMQSGAFLNNAGIMNAIGTATEPTNCTIINAGAIYGTSLTAFNGTPKTSSTAAPVLARAASTSVP